ncbi:MAG: hypothetical protein GQ564_24070 [Bacteroidales bacterium]|nr:hypothetical protein [Bacteroidales bacterium]
MKKLTNNLFKVLFLLMITMTLMVTTGCEDEDSDVDPIIGTWMLYEVDVTVEGTTTTNSPSEVNSNMTVVFTTGVYTAIGVLGDDVINEVGTWTRVDSNTITLVNTDGTVTLKKEGEYYTAEFDIGIVGRFKKQ